MRLIQATFLFGIGMTLLLRPAAVSADDWPHWRGPHHDGMSRETGLADTWPEDGPAELWRIPLGAGFSSVSVVGDKAYTMFGSDEGEFVVCLDANSGKTVWKTRSGELLENEYGDGPRATPTVEEGRVYTNGGAGSLLCLDAATGEQVWGFNTVEKFGGKVLDFGMSASPVVMGDMLIVVTNAKDAKTLVALDKKTGETLWTSLDDKGGYSTPILIDVDGVPQIVVLTGEAVVGVSPEDGREFWRHEWITTLDANVATPIFHDGKLFISSGYGTGCALFALSAAGGKPAAEKLWASKDMKNYFSTCVLRDGYLYGFNNTILTCMEFETGKTVWRTRGFNRGSVLLADGKLIIYGERADLALAEATPEDYKPLAEAEVLGGKTWTVPTLSGGRLFVRNEEELVCLKLTP